MRDKNMKTKKMKSKHTLTCKACAGLMDHYAVGALGESDQNRLDAHLETCPACARTFAQIKETYAFLHSGGDAAPTPDWDTSWRVIRKNVLTETSGRRAPVRSYRRVWTLAGAVAIFVVGIFLGRYMNLWSPGGASRDTAAAQQLYAAFQEHVENIKPVILQYANTGRTTEIRESIAIDREIAARFLADNRLLQGRLDRGKNKRMTLLLEELDMILTEIANLTANEPENLQLVKELIKMKGILLKIELMHPRGKPEPVRSVNI